MKKPLCRHCGERHYLTEPHVLSDLTTVTMSNTKPPKKAPSVTVSNEPLPKVTESVTEGNTPHCPTCRCFGPKYKTNAERQAAYRERKREE